MIVGVPRETFPGERRVALVPATVATLKKAGLSVVVEKGAGYAAGFTDEEYTERGAELVDSADQVFSQADIVLQVRFAGANPEVSKASDYKEGQIVIGQCDPLSEPGALNDYASRKVTTFALELLPRITRAQSMDILSSMATIAGYQAVLIAANTLPRMFPMLMTAAGTVTPAKVFIMGAGVAGLQAIATAKRLGAVVQAYDLRPVVKEQVESLGAKFVVLDLDTGSSETAGGYAKAMDEAFYKRQRELMTEVIKECHVVITTAAIPGKKAPILVTKKMVAAMAPGSVIVDLAAERGGNCELTKADEHVVENGVTVIGPCNLPSSIPFHASEMYAKNISTFLLNMIKEGEFDLDLEDEIQRDTLLTRDGDVVNSRVRELLELPPLTPPEPAATEETTTENATQSEEASSDNSAEQEATGQELTEQESTGQSTDEETPEKPDDEGASS